MLKKYNTEMTNIEFQKKMKHIIEILSIVVVEIICFRLDVIQSIRLQEKSAYNFIGNRQIKYRGKYKT
jgi:hypothetical protein